jgi:hypothetical protein
MDSLEKALDIFLFQNIFASGIETTISTKWCIIKTRNLPLDGISGKISDFSVSVREVVSKKKHTHTHEPVPVTGLFM